MTVEPTSGGGAVAGYEEDFGSLGLEDVGASDLMLPRLNINHDDARFVNTLTKEEFPALTVVVLGLVKQRIMWPPKLEDDSKPRCKSPDNVHGFPNMNESGPKKNLFPWASSNYEPSQLRTVDLAPGENPNYPHGWSSNGHGTLPCDSCSFAKWGKDEDNKNVPPPCSEQHTYPLLYMQGEGDDVSWIPALMTLQRSAIKNSRAFINGFAQRRQPFFTQYVGLTLRAEARGGNEYAVPEFRNLGPSDRNMWGEYAEQLRGVREMVRMAPRPQEDDSPASADNSNAAPAASAPAAAPTAPPTAPAPPAAAPTPPTPEAPVSEAPAAPTPPAPPTPPTPPAAAAPPPPAAPAAPPAAPAAPPAPPTPPPAAPSGGESDSGLPF